MFVPNRRTGGKDKFCVSCGTPTTRSLVLLGLINREFVEHQFAISQRSLLRSKIEYESDDVLKMKFLKLWNLSGYSERTMSKRPTCQK